MKIKGTELKIIKADIQKTRADVLVSADIFRNDERALRLSIRKVFRTVERKSAKKIAFPPAGVMNGFPLVGSAKIMTQEVLRHLRENRSRLKEIVFCLPTQKEYAVFKKAVTGYVEHILYKLSEGPYVTVDAIIETKGSVVLIERMNPPYGLALPGGFVDYGESLEEAVRREAHEETNMKLAGLRQFHTYSNPRRDPRFHTIGTVFIANGQGRPKSGDDAKGLKIVACKDLLKLNYAFDHKEIIRDYLKRKKNGQMVRF